MQTEPLLIPAVRNRTKMEVGNTIMLDDFFYRALFAGMGLAVMAGPIGCFVVWRRMSYFGDTLAHSALLGTALGLLFQVNLLISVFFISILLSLLLLFLQKNRTIPVDALLGMLSHGALAIGLVVLSLMSWIRFDVQSLLFGDILSVTRSELAFISGFAVVFLTILITYWEKLVCLTVSPELAEAEGIDPRITNFVFMILLAMVIAVSMKIVGVLLITALLIIPAITARNLVTSPEAMAVYAIIAGCISVALGLFTSLELDTPSGPSIIVASLVLFAASISPLARIFRMRKT